MWNEDKLDDLLTQPTDALMEAMKTLPGDIVVIGAGGKMGPSLCVLASKAIARAVAQKGHRRIPVFRRGQPYIPGKARRGLPQRRPWTPGRYPRCPALKTSSTWRVKNSAPRARSI